jgi:hypothetical protein
MNEDAMSLVSVAEQDFEEVENIYFIIVVSVCKRVVGGEEL